MFRIGEFAQIAQVSGRQLRFYDQLGLLQPAHTDARTGYRYYSIRQLPLLNRILALKELGLSLEQIGPLLANEISPGELRAMLTMKRAQLEQSLSEEQARLRHIESRIAQIDSQGGIKDYDVILKSVPSMPFLSLRSSFDSMDEVVPMVRAIAEEGTRQINAAVRDKLIVVAGARERFFRGSAQQGRPAARKAMIDRKHDLAITKQAAALNISRGSVYYLPRPVPAADFALMRRLDELHLEFPFAGSGMLRDLLAAEGSKIGRRHVKSAASTGCA